MPTLDWIGKQAVVNHHREVPYRLIHCDGELSAGDPELGEGEYGLYVNLGSYSRGAVELERNRVKLRLINGEQFVELVLENYTKLLPRYRSLIPLKQIYVADLKES